MLSPREREDANGRNIFNRFDHRDSNLWSFARPAGLSSSREALQIDRRENESAKLFNYIRVEHIKRIFEDSSLEILTGILSPPLSLPFPSLPSVFPLTRSEASSEGKLINYESYFPIQ